MHCRTTTYVGDWRLRSLLAFAAVFLLSGQVRAQQPDVATKRVVVSPTVYLSISESDEYARARDAVNRGLVSFAASHSNAFSVVTPSELIARIESPVTYSQSVELQTLRTEMGMQNYKRLETTDAIENLQKSVAGFRELQYGLVAPEKYAEALMYLSLSYLEQSDRRRVLEPIDVLKEMILHDPSRVFREGYYPGEVVQFYETAREALEEDLAEGPLKLQRPQEVAEIAEAEYVVHANVLPTRNGAHEMVVHLYSATERTHLPSVRMALPDLRTETLEEAANRLVSRQLVCLMEPVERPETRVVESKGESPWAIQLNFAWSSFLKLPGPERLVPFNNYGAGIAAEFALTQEFSLMTAVQILTSTVDKNGVLFEDFTTFRTFFGGELGLNIGDFRVGIAPLLEVSTHGELVMCEGDQQTRVEGCTGNSRQTFDSDSAVLLGVNVRPRIAYKILPALEFNIIGSGSFFFYPLSGREINFPVSVETGFQYRF